MWQQKVRWGGMRVNIVLFVDAGVDRLLKYKGLKLPNTVNTLGNYLQYKSYIFSKKDLTIRPPMWTHRHKAGVLEINTCRSTLIRRTSTQSSIVGAGFNKFNNS